MRNRLIGTRKVYLVFIILVSILLFPVSVSADRSEVDSSVTLEKGLSAVSNICSQANNSISTKSKILVYSSKNGLLTFSNKEYSKLEIEDKEEFMKTALKATKESSLGILMKNKTYNFIANQDNAVSSAVKFLQTDTSADFVSAWSLFRPFSGPIGIVLGCLCLAIFLFMSLSIVFDIAYIVLPGFQSLLEHGNTNKRPFGVSREAWKACKEAESGSSNKSVMSLYIQMRVPVMILIAICLGYVISGAIYNVMIYFIDAFSPLV